MQFRGKRMPKDGSFPNELYRILFCIAVLERLHKHGISTSARTSNQTAGGSTRQQMNRCSGGQLSGSASTFTTEGE